MPNIGRLRRLFRWWPFQATIILAVCTVAILSWRSRIAERPNYAANRYLDCLEQSDATCLASFVSEAERMKGAPTADQFERFLKEIYAPRMRDYRLAGARTYEKGLDREVFDVAYQS